MVHLKRLFAFSLPGIILSVGVLTTTCSKVHAETAIVRDNVEVTASEDKVIVGVKGVDCTSAQKELLELVNKVRYEACTDGNVPDPRNTSRMLTKDDYKAIKLGVECTKAAQIRAAEGSVVLGHVRPNGTSCFGVINNDVSGAHGENLAWNNDLSSDLNAWISEKDDYIAGDFSGGGHYRNLINPNYLFIGISTFNPFNDSVSYGSYKPDWSCTAAQFSTNDKEITNLEPAKNDTVIQKMEIPVSSVSSIQISGDAVLSEGGSSAFGLYGMISVSGVANGFISDCPIYDGITWSSSDTSVADIDSDGVCKAEGLGSTVITATIGTGDDAISTQREVMVVHEGTTITGIKTPDMITVETLTPPVLGKTVEAILNNGKTIEINVEWDDYDSDKLLTHFKSEEFDVRGQAAGYTVSQRVHVNAAKIKKIYTDPSTITTTYGTLPALPSNVKINLSNNFTWTYNVIWDEKYKEYCNNINGGTYTITGKVSPGITTDKGIEYLDITATLVVEPMAEKDGVNDNKSESGKQDVSGADSINKQDETEDDKSESGKQGASGADPISNKTQDEVINRNTEDRNVVSPVSPTPIVTEATSIGDGTYKNDNTITNFVIGENIETIGSNAFEGCKNLKKVKIGSNVTDIKQKAFANCTSITSITIPAKTVKLGNNLFTGCKNLKTITIKTKKLTAKSVSKNAFKGVSSKTVIKVPKKMKKTYTKLFRKKGLSKKVKIKAIR